MVGGVLVIVVGGAFLAIRKRKSTSAAHTAGAPQVAARVERETAGERTVPRPSSPSAGNMLDALKEELFQLESDRVQGKILQQEYEKAKAGLDMLMRRQMR